MNNSIHYNFSDTKPHYQILDGLRGVAALLVLWYHVFEGLGFAGYVNGVSDGMITTFNHGYLAVDFFFILSGFVIGYAYDSRWQKGFTTKEFFRRRIIRLHPMVVLGAIIGLVTFIIQGAVTWDGKHIATSMMMLSLLAAIFMIPAVPGCNYEIRGNGEMYPLNGPAWSLFFEYIGNILYALFIHRLSTRILGIITTCLGIILAWFTIADVAHTGSFGVGWTMDNINFWGGMLRMMFPYTMGMFLSRIFKPIEIRGSFWICSIILFLLFAVPYNTWNGLFESFCIIIVFPILIWIGASGKTTDHKTTTICHFLGEISYPLYIIHYPFMYLFYAWMIKHQIYNLSQCLYLSIAVTSGIIILAWLIMRCYDIPIRRWLSKL